MDPIFYYLTFHSTVQAINIYTNTTIINRIRNKFSYTIIILKNLTKHFVQYANIQFI